MESNITAILGAYKNLEDTVKFIHEFYSKFPTIPMVVGMVGNSKDYQEALINLYKDSEYITLVGGKEDVRVPFSENWDAAINAVETERFVFLHNDMYLHRDFFRNLEYSMSNYGPGSFYLYMTVEPLENAGFIRPGKIVAPFGHSREEFDETGFNRFADKYIKEHYLEDSQKGYGFYLAGFMESLKKVGGFDYEHFKPMFCEDDDLNIRIRLAGFDVRVLPSVLVYHFGSKTVRLDTAVSMSNLEIESNRHFARKWGFEARFLWETGYEKMPVVSLGTEKIAYTYSGMFQNPGFVPRKLDIINVEPFVDFICMDDRVNTEYFKASGLEGKLIRPDKLEEADIVITQVGPTDFNALSSLMGNLRFGYKKLKPGSHAKVGSYEVDILRTNPNQCRVDPVNYLLEQKSKQYD